MQFNNFLFFELESFFLDEKDDSFIFSVARNFLPISAHILKYLILLISFFCMYLYNRFNITPFF